MSNLVMRELLGFKRAGDLGLEIEVEAEDTLPTDVPKPWVAQGDDSLRNIGVEYVTDRPIACDSTKYGIIKGLTDKLKNCKVVEGSPRTSVHVHVNITEFTPLQLWTAITTYWLLENLLIKYCGEQDREGNVFCLRLCDSEGIMRYIREDLRARDGWAFSTFRQDDVKYASQNLGCISRLGSLEYRGMRGTIDPDIIDRWSTEMYNVVHRSKRFSSPENMLDTFLNMNNVTEFMCLVLSRPFVETLQYYKDWKKLVSNNVGLLSELCYYHDWEKWQSNLNEKAKELGILGRTKYNPPPEFELHPLPGQVQRNTNAGGIAAAVDRMIRTQIRERTNPIPTPPPTVQWDDGI